MKTNIHFWLYLAELFLEWEMFQTKLAEKIKTRTCVQQLCSFLKTVPFMRLI